MCARVYLYLPIYTSTQVHIPVHTHIQIYHLCAGKMWKRKSGYIRRKVASGDVARVGKWMKRPGPLPHRTHRKSTQDARLIQHTLDRDDARPIPLFKSSIGCMNGDAGERRRGQRTEKSKKNRKITKIKRKLQRPGCCREQKKTLASG